MALAVIKILYYTITGGDGLFFSKNDLNSNFWGIQKVVRKTPDTGCNYYLICHRIIKPLQQ